MGKFLLVVIAVVAGGAYFLHTRGQLEPALEQAKEGVKHVVSEASKAVSSAGAADSNNTPASSGTGTSAGGPSAATSSSRATPTQVDEAAQRLGQSKLEAAEEHFAGGRFREAVDLLDDFLKDDPQVSEALYNKLTGFRLRSFNHMVICRDFRRDQRLDGKTTLLYLVGKDEPLEVMIKRETATDIHYAGKSFGSMIKKQMVRERKDLTAEQVRERDLRRFKDKLGEAKKAGPRAYLTVVKFCVERDLREKVPYVVTKAIEDQNPEFFSELFEDKAASLFQRYLLLLERQKSGKASKRVAKLRSEVFRKILDYYPNTAVAIELRRHGAHGDVVVASSATAPEPARERELAKKIEKRITAKEKTVSSNSRARAILNEADVIYAQAMKEYRQSFPGQPNADKHLKIAYGLFVKAQEKYEAAFKIDPSDAIDTKVAKCQREIYSCQKQMKIWD